ncbi:hypothetical protein DAEQUDRAFT_767234 [Daedalea quercina L-15889]|uniref:Uncharacterized protein n=1 Tax=Daedalea quercina L-15889 TaxID=1314783 RepID=A0A165NSQ9_9APHY|nr:hypothetical protein DAEQUDRAFT_767234 [Daedalea quercina L-15889]
MDPQSNTMWAAVGSSTKLMSAPESGDDKSAKIEKLEVPKERALQILRGDLGGSMTNRDPTLTEVYKEVELRPDKQREEPGPSLPLSSSDTRDDGPPLPMPRFSQELLDMVIDFISDRRDLLACCQANSVLVPRSRSHLYRRIRLRPLTRIDNYERTYTSEGLLPYVREVEILGCLTPNAYPGDDANSGLNDEGDPDHKWIDAVVPLLTRLDSSQIEWVDMRDLSWGDISRDTRGFLLTHFKQVRRLTLSAIDFWNSNQMFRTLNAFPSIHGLSMENLSWHRANHARKQLEHIADLHLRYLHIGQTEFARYGPFIKWLLGRREVVVVDDAFIVWEDTEIMSLIMLLRRLASSLKSLIYQQCMVMPGSEVVEARLQAAAAAAAIPAPVAVVQTQGPPTATAPDVPNNDAVAGQDAPQPMGVDNEPQDAVNGDHQVDIPIELDDSDDEGDGGGEGDANDNGDDVDDGAQTSGPPIEMDDDEPEEESLVEESVAENLTFPREKDALRDGMDLLNAMPIEGSRVERLNARIAWSSLAIFGIKLMSQMFTASTKAFGLLLVLPPMAQWDGIDWLSIDSVLDDVAQRASKDATLELSFLGAFTQREEDLPSIRAYLTTRLPLLVARRRWTARYDRNHLE